MTAQEIYNNDAEWRRLTERIMELHAQRGELEAWLLERESESVITRGCNIFEGRGEAVNV